MKTTQVYPGILVGDRVLRKSDAHPPTMACWSELGDFRIIAGSAVGQYHRYRKAPRDDAFVVRSAGPWVAIAVADGLGSRPLSRFGASYVADCLSAALLDLVAGDPPPVSNSGPLPPVQDHDGPENKNASKIRRIRYNVSRSEHRSFRLFQRQLLTRAFALPHHQELAGSGPGSADEPKSAASTQTGSISIRVDEMPDSREAESACIDNRVLETIVQHAFRNAHSGLKAYAASMKRSVSDFGSTAVAVLFNIHTGQCAAGQVGDGAILGLRQSGSLKELVVEKETGDLQTTHTIGSDRYSAHLSVSILDHDPGDPLDTIYIMTDGISTDILYALNQEGLDRWGRLVRKNLWGSHDGREVAKAMLEWLMSYTVQGSGDDRTLIAISRKPAQTGAR